MDSSPKKDEQPKKETRMIIISPQELAELGLFQDLTSPKPAGPSKEAPFILNEHVSKVTNPVSSLKVEQVPNPRRFQTLLHKKIASSRLVLNAQKPKINSTIKKKQKNILSPEASLIKDILLSAARASKKEETISKPEENSSNQNVEANNCVEIVNDKLTENKNIDADESKRKDINRKEVNILSNRTISLSNEEIKQLVALSSNQAKTSSEKDTKLHPKNKEENNLSSTSVSENISKNKKNFNIINETLDSNNKEPTKSSEGTICLSNEEIIQLVVLSDNESRSSLEKDTELQPEDKVKHNLSHTSISENILNNKIFNINDETLDPDIKNPTKTSHTPKTLRHNITEHSIISKKLSKVEIASKVLETYEILQLEPIRKNNNQPNLNKPTPVDDVLEISPTPEKNEYLVVDADDDNDDIIIMSRTENKSSITDNTDVGESKPIIEEFTKVCEQIDTIKTNEIKNSPLPIQIESFETEIQPNTDETLLHTPIKVGRSRKDQLKVNNDENIEICESFETMKQTGNTEIEETNTATCLETKSKKLEKPKRGIEAIRHDSIKIPEPITNTDEVINEIEETNITDDFTIIPKPKKQVRSRKETLKVNPNDDMEIFESFDKTEVEHKELMDATESAQSDTNDPLTIKDEPTETEPIKTEIQKKKKVGRPRKESLKIKEDNALAEIASAQKPKKIGRPRKHQIEIHTDSIVQTFSTEAEENNIDSITTDTSESPQVNAVKKKGRPRKDSKRGRKRKQEEDINPAAIMETSLEIFEEKIQELNSGLDPISDKSENSSPASIKLPPEQEGTCKSVLEISVCDLETSVTSLEIPASNLEAPVSNLETPLFRKRGRPKKNVTKPKMENLESSLTGEDPLSFTKAGAFEEAEIGTSKSGRKRKKINYFDMENNFMDDDMPRVYKRPKLSQSNYTDDDSGKNKTKLQTPKPATVTGEPTADIKKEEVVTTQDDSITEEYTEYKVNSYDREKKYKYTGETTRMMQSIFSLAFKTSTLQKEVSETSDGDNSVATEQSFKPASSKRGRKKLEDISKNVVIDEDGRVTCTSCRDKIPKDNWKAHNRNVHCNLSWREGDQFLNVDDEIFLKHTLKPIIQEDKKLTCYKCSDSFTSVNDFINHKEVCEGIVLGGQVTCAVCEEQMEKTKWSFHKRRKHNNLTWRLGDPPLNLGDQALVLDILNGLYKNRVPLYCYKCNTAKKSVVGFLSHQSQCGLASEDVKIKCNYCERKVLPVSMACHIKLVHKTIKEKNSKQSQSTMKAIEEPLTKRKAAKNALAWFVKGKDVAQEEAQYFSEQTAFKDNSLIMDILKQDLDSLKLAKCKFENCTFVTSELNRLLEHLDICEKKPEEYYTCMKCCTIFVTPEEVKKHLYDIHGVYLPLDDDAGDSDYEEEEYVRDKELNKIRRQEKVKVMMSNKTTKIKPRFISTLTSHAKKLFQCSFEYTLEFCNEHYTQSVLFDHLRYSKLEWNLLEEALLVDYLPKTEESCQVSRKAVDYFENVLGREHDFRTYDLFEANQEEGVTTMFCGGPVFAMAWLPTPHILLRCNQFLAVAVGNNFDSTYLTNATYSEPSVIQFWDFGILKNKKTPQPPSLHCCLAVDDGPIWHLEWCPSGGYDENVPSNKDKLQRLGLLAVAGSTSIVCIYAIPFLDEEEKGLVYRSKPLIKLRLTLAPDNLKQKYFTTKISWGKASGHKYIAVGYSDGMVGLFDLETTSKALRFKDEQGVDNLLPFKIIKAHLHYISVLSLIHHGNGRRWLLTGSIDCNVTMWDLITDTKISVNKKKVISDGTWLTNWLAYVTTSDESNTNNVPVFSSVSSHRSYMYEPTTITYSPSTISSVSVSDWLNGILQGSTMGEMIGIFPHQLLYSVDSYKRMKAHRFCMGYTKLINKNKSPEERVAEDIEQQKALQYVPRNKDSPSTNSAAAIFSKSNDMYNEYEPGNYLEAKKKYGLVFCDMILNTYDDFPDFLQDKLQNNTKVLEMSKPNLYPMQKINKICFNPNCQASLYYATGYQTGFVRIRYMKFLESDRQVV